MSTKTVACTHFKRTAQVFNVEADRDHLVQAVQGLVMLFRTPQTNQTKGVTAPGFDSARPNKAVLKAFVSPFLCVKRTFLCIIQDIG